MTKAETVRQEWQEHHQWIRLVVKDLHGLRNLKISQGYGRLIVFEQGSEVVIIVLVNRQA
jgi:hypothetical protein